VRDGHDPTASYDPGPEFWSRFVRRFWGRRPTVIRQPFARAIASPAEVFAGMVAAADRVRTEDHDFALTIDGVRVGADVERWLPRRKDGSLEGLAARISADLRGSDFAMFVRAFQLELGWEFWRRVRGFLRGLYVRVGLPADRAEVDLFSGSYPRSRSGIHRDSADVFCFVVDGRKRIRVWPRTAFSENSYWYGVGAGRRPRAGSTCLDGEPGDILYWPSSYWHVGESRGGTVSSLSLGLYPRDSLAATAARLV
jgi:50S ribosomal protein L16 3-hydroxylase